jgi:MFS family permease
VRRTWRAGPARGDPAAVDPAQGVLLTWPGAKAALCAAYGLGVGPLLMARGTREFPEQSGAVSGILYPGIALGGVVFPLLVGALAQSVVIAQSYWFCAAAASGLLAGALVMRVGPGRGQAPDAPLARGS